MSFARLLLGAGRPSTERRAAEYYKNTNDDDTRTSPTARPLAVPVDVGGAARSACRIRAGQASSRERAGQPRLGRGFGTDSLRFAHGAIRCPAPRSARSRMALFDCDDEPKQSPASGSSWPQPTQFNRGEMRWTL